MAQETTEEFAFRLQQALEGHPLAPPTPFGRQSWLRERLEKEAGVNVSSNTIHKWVRGMSRPREDNIRNLARILQVDEVWLALGRRPVADKNEVTARAAKSSGATLLLAGAIEMSGGRVTFPAPEDEGVSLWADLGEGRTGVLVVVGQEKGSTVSFVVPEPVGSNRIVSVSLRQAGCPTTGCVEVVDLTDVPRQNFGGFSVIQGEVRKDGKLKVEGQRNLLSPLAGFAEALA